MLLNLLSHYLDDVESEIRKLQDVYVESYEEEILAHDRINLRIRVRFSEGYLLEVNEAVVADVEQIKHLGYRYHFQDRHNNLVFRYDNTPHFPKLENFPHHKHIPDGVISIEEHSIFEAIEAAREYVSKE